MGSETKRGKGTPKPIRPERGWSVISPWTNAPWLMAARVTRRDVAKFLDAQFGESLGVGGWTAKGWRFVKITMTPEVR